MVAPAPNSLDLIGDICTQMLISYDIYARNCHISGNELAILYTLWVDGACTQKHIAEKCQIVKQTVNTLCKKYEADGLLSGQVGESDKREKTLHFTEQGRAFARTVVEPLLALEQEVIAEFGEARMKNLLNEFKELQIMLSKKLERNHG
ncbi:MarR family winged helix-turn-helix transcriptional regulator [Neisseria sp. CCUG12390]|uniref:MarR family winged helix-turn-helix transcriptional regulator n=1 Tax=Neisseria sp. CCUG12390 TaxID=3392035 RepID=UPI003A0FFE32